MCRRLDFASYTILAFDTGIAAISIASLHIYCPALSRSENKATPSEPTSPKPSSKCICLAEQTSKLSIMQTVGLG